jgi:superfamily I DNA/RNA helicase
MKWQARFQYIHVDEYQDTNRVQYELMRLLTGPKQNVCVVGDEDQSIYRWRGADVSILLSFSRDFPAARIIKLERNYRSTQRILNAAGAVVANNPERLGKSLSAEKGEGTNLKYFEARRGRTRAHRQRRFGSDLRRGIPHQFPVTCIRRSFPAARLALQACRRIQFLQSRGSERRTGLRSVGDAS